MFGAKCSSRLFFFALCSSCFLSCVHAQEHSRAESQERALVHDDRSLVHNDRALIHNDRALVHSERSFIPMTPDIGFLNALAIDDAKAMLANAQLNAQIMRKRSAEASQPHLHVLSRRSSSSINSFFGSSTTATIVIAILLGLSSIILLLFVFASILFIRHRRQKAKQPALRDLLLGSISHPTGSFARRESSIWGGSTIWGPDGRRGSAWESGLESGGAIELKSATGFGFGGVNGYGPGYGTGMAAADASPSAVQGVKGNPSGEWVKFSDVAKTPMSGPYPTFPKPAKVADADDDASSTSSYPHTP